MKKILIILLMFIIGTPVFSYDSLNSQLSKIENYLFGYDYQNKSKESRLARIEKDVYGVEKKGKLNERLAKLSKDLYIDVLDEKDDSDDFYDMDNNTYNDSDNYPIIDNIEKQLAIKPVDKSNLNLRISTIENKLFNKVNTSDDFYTRVEKIKNKLGMNSKHLFTDDEEYDNSDEEVLEYLVDNSEAKHVNNPFKLYKLSLLEQKILNDTYPYDNSDRRLARLEKHIFSTDFCEDDDKIRISRLETAIKSMRCEKHDHSKLQKTVNTAMQIATMVLMVLAIIL